MKEILFWPGSAEITGVDEGRLLPAGLLVDNGGGRTFEAWAEDEDPAVDTRAEGGRRRGERDDELYSTRRRLYAIVFGRFDGGSEVQIFGFLCWRKEPKGLTQDLVQAFGTRNWLPLPSTPHQRKHIANRKLLNTSTSTKHIITADILSVL